MCFLSVGEGGRASRSTRKRFRSVKKIDQAAAGMRPMSDHWKGKHREHEGRQIGSESSRGDHPRSEPASRTHRVRARTLTSSRECLEPVAEAASLSDSDRAHRYCWQTTMRPRPMLGQTPPGHETRPDRGGRTSEQGQRRGLARRERWRGEVREGTRIKSCELVSPSLARPREDGLGSRTLGARGRGRL